MADWVVAGGTLVLAVIAALQDIIRAWFYKPKLTASIQTGPPDCHFVPLTDKEPGQAIGMALYMRLWVVNEGNARAEHVEVYARRLERKRADGAWETVQSFPPMNLTWSNVGGTHYPLMAPRSGKHCDLARVVDPAIRSNLRTDNNPALGLSPDLPSLAFVLVAMPNHLGHIVGPGDFRLLIQLAAGNAAPVEKIVDISLRRWYSDEGRMLSEGVGVGIRDLNV